MMQISVNALSYHYQPPTAPPPPASVISNGQDGKPPNGLFFLVKTFYWPTRRSSPRAFQWALVRSLEMQLNPESPLG
jgi:hypothetical protein